MFAWLGYTIWFGLFNITVRLPLWLLDSVVKIYKMITFALPSYLLFGISPGVIICHTHYYQYYF